MDIKVERIAGGSRLTMDYKVAGFANGGADNWPRSSTRCSATRWRGIRKYAAAMPQTR